MSRTSACRTASVPTTKSPKRNPRRGREVGQRRWLRPIGGQLRGAVTAPEPEKLGARQPAHRDRRNLLVAHHDGLAPGDLARDDAADLHALDLPRRLRLSFPEIAGDQQRPIVAQRLSGSFEDDLPAG